MLVLIANYMLYVVIPKGRKLRTVLVENDSMIARPTFMYHSRITVVHNLCKCLPTGTLQKHKIVSAVH